MRIRYDDGRRKYTKNIPLKRILRKLAQRFRDWVLDKPKGNGPTQTVRDRHGVYIEKSVSHTVRTGTIAKRVCITALAIALIILAVRFLLGIVIIAAVLAILALLFATFVH